MKKKLLKIVNSCIDILDRVKSKLSLTESENQSYPFQSLSPISEADDDEQYCKILSWALENRKVEDIKNIALSGPIGSGKSSVIRTFQRKNKDKSLHFLNISLASFNNAQNDNDQKNAIPRLIELSILQQLFYHEKDKRIPDSRFRKIKSFSKFNLASKAIVAVILLIALGFVFFNSFVIDNIIRSNLPAKWEDVIHISSIIIASLGIGLIFYNSIRFIYNIRINKLKFNAAEIEITDSISKSILNHHLDEILYFFEVTKYNVVIIEDLDRFGQTEIFTKLREINFLINHSKKIGRDIVFIYAIKDDMFLNDDRTKFFDFIIPIIPVINFSNSNEILLEKKKKGQLKISENLIDNISLFIDDMRLLNNIINEYYIHHLKLDKKLDQDRLLSIIVYKNIFPSDFSKLIKNQGILYDIINGKLSFIQRQNERINKEIQEINLEIEKINSLLIKDNKELRSLYLMHYLGKLKGLRTIQINSQIYEYSQLIEEELFDSLVSDSVTYTTFQNTRQQKIPHAFADIEKEVDPDNTYLERKQLIDDWTKNKIETLKKEIEGLENEKSELKSRPLKELLRDQEITIDSNNSLQNQLISVLLRNGYIEENYLDYLSIFYEGSITKEDRKFLLDIRSQISNEFNYKLTKKEKLLSKINPVEFEREYILNLGLVDFLLSKNKYSQQKIKLFNLLSTESENVIRYINEYIDSEYETGRFIKELCKYWKNFWSYVSDQSSFSDEKKINYFKLIIRHARTTDIVSIADKSNLVQFVENKDDFFSLLPFDDKVKEVIEALSIKFTSLNQDDLTDDVLKFLLEGEFYQINIPMMELILKGLGTYNKTDFGSKNYTAAINSSSEILINQIDRNINLYVETVYLALEKNRNEEETNYLKLLNNNELEIENKKNIVRKVETIITDISDISDNNVSEVLLTNFRVLPNWENVIYSYEKNNNDIGESLVEYMNDLTNAETLSETKIPTDNNDDDRKYRDFISNLMLTESIEDKAYGLLMKSVPYVYSTFNFTDLSYEKAELIIENKILTLTESNLSHLKEEYGILHIRLIENRKSEFFKDMSQFELQSDDFTFLLESESITVNEKCTIIEFAEDSILATSSSSLSSIGQLIISKPTIDISDYLLEELLTNTELDINRRLQVFCVKDNQLFDSLITNFLETLPKPYSDIARKGKRPIIEENVINQKFVEVLYQQKYISKFKKEKKGIRISTFLNR